MKYKCLLVGMVIASLSGCDSGTPKCNNDDAKNLVVEIARKEAKKSLQRSFRDTTKFEVVKFTVKNIRTINHDTKLDVYQCAANLQITMLDDESKHPNTRELPITYNIQKTDDNNGEFYINVYGL